MSLPVSAPDEPRLAVVDVAGGSDRQRHAANRRSDLVDLVVGERAAVEQQPAVADDADHRRLVQHAAVRRELLLDRAGEARQLGRAGARRRRPAPTVSSTSPPVELGEPHRRARARVSRRSRGMRRHRESARRAARDRGRARERPFERGERELVGANAPAGAGGGAAARRAPRCRRRSRPAARRAACRPRSRRGPRPPSRLARAEGSSLVHSATEPRRSRGRRRAAARGAARRWPAPRATAAR